MLAIIETKGATHIVINVPVETSHESLPALTRMLENNCVFVQRSWREVTTTKAEMSIIMGNTFIAEHEGAELLIRKADASEIIGAEFVKADSDVFASFAKARKKHDDETQRLRNEVAVLRDRIAQLESQAAITED